MAEASRIAVVWVGSIVFGMGSGFLAGSWAVRRATPSRTVSAREFVLTDEKGHTGAKVSWDQGQPTIQLFDRENKMRSALFLEPNGVPDLYLYDQNGNTRAALNLFDSGVPNLAFIDETQDSMVLTEYDKAGSYNLRFLRLDKNGPPHEIGSQRTKADDSGVHTREIAGAPKAVAH